MSEFLAEALVVVRPDTTKFRADLEAQLLAATRGITVPVPVVPTSTTAAGVQQGVARASQEAAVAAERTTAATQRQAAAAASLGAANEKAIQTQTALTRVTAEQARIAALVTKAELQLAEAEDLASLKTTQLAANRARLTAASGAVATSERAVLAALASGNAELIASAQGTLALAQAQELQARSAVRATIAANQLAVAEERQAAATALAGRGAAATGLSLLGARGATLAASGSFLAGAAAAVFLARSLEEATDAEETFRRATLLLGEDLATSLSRQAGAIGDAFALDDDDVLKFETQVGKILIAVGLTEERTAELSQGIVKLAADMASFNRVPIETTLKAIQSGLAGNTRGLRALGVVLTNAEVQQRALADTGKDTTAELTKQELVLARYRIILEDAAFQAGAFAAAQGSLEAQTQQLSVNVAELQETIGKGLLPVVTGLVIGLNETFDAANQAASGLQSLGSAVPLLGDSVAGVDLGGFAEDALRVSTRVTLLGPVLGGASLAFDHFGDSAEEASGKLTLFDKIVGSARNTLNGLAEALESVRSRLPTARQTEELDLTLAQAGGDQNAELRILREREERQQEFLERILERPQTRANVELATKAAENLRQTREQIESILSEQTSEANKLAASAAKAARDVDQALINAINVGEQTRRTAIIEAAATASLQDDIRANTALQRFFRNKIEQVRKTVKDAETAARTVATLTSQLATVTNTIRELERRQREILAEQRRERIEGQRESLALDVQIAQSTGNVQAEARARQAEIDFIERQIRATRKNSLQRKRLIAELRAAQRELRELKKEREKTADATSSLFFDFLQKQQGFAANLLGNLIPGDATAGLVGNVSQPAAPVEVGVAPGTAVGAVAGVEASREQGLTRGDINTELTLLRSIDRRLAQLAGRQQHPEANFQRRQQSGSFDTVPHGA